MRRGRELEPEFKNELRRSIEMLGVSQDQLAGQIPGDALVSQGFISNLLSDSRRVKDPNRIKGLADTIEEITDSQLAAGALSEQDRIAIRNTWDRLRIIFGLDIEGFFAQPGGIVPQKARDYIKRNEHGLMLTLLRMPFSVILDGPIQSGKSTLSSVLETGAVNAGIPVVVLDCGQSNFRGEDANEKLYEHLTEQAIDKWEIPEATKTTTRSTDFVDWVKDVSQGSDKRSKQANRLLIVDGIDRLSHQSALDLIDALRGLKRNQALLNVSLCATLSFRNRGMLEFEEFALDSGIRVERIRWFSAQEVTDMAAAMGLDDSQDEVKQIWNWFGGQPYLTHLALSDLRKGDATSVDEIKHNSLIGQPASYAAHLKAIKGLFTDGGSLLKEIAQKTNVQLSPLDSEVFFLDASGFIVPDKSVKASPGKLVYRISSEFYAHLIDVLYESNS